MKENLYRGYKIVATAQKEGKVWRSRASVSLSCVTIQLQDDETLFDTERDTEEHALRLGQHWVNNRLQRRQRVS